MGKQMYCYRCSKKTNWIKQSGSVYMCSGCGFIRLRKEKLKWQESNDELHKEEDAKRGIKQRIDLDKEVSDGKDN